MTNNDIPLNTVNTQINWRLPITLQNGESVSLLSKNKGNISIKGAGFTCIVSESTGLPISDVFNWDLFPIKNTNQ